MFDTTDAMFDMDKFDTFKLADAIMMPLGLSTWWCVDVDSEVTDLQDFLTAWENREENHWHTGNLKGRKEPIVLHYDAPDYSEGWERHKELRYASFQTTVTNDSLIAWWIAAEDLYQQASGHYWGFFIESFGERADGSFEVHFGS